MRLRCVLPMLLLAGAFAIASAQPTAPFILRIMGPGSAVAGQPVWVRVLLQNTSDNAMEFGPDAFVAPGSMWLIQDPSGQAIPPKEEGGWASSGGTVSIAPGEVLDQLIRVPGRYDLSRPGTYTLQLKRPAAEDLGGPAHLRDGFISSNIITFNMSTEVETPSVPLTLSLAGPETFVSGGDVSAKVLVKNVSGQEIVLLTAPDGTIDDVHFRLETTVGPNKALFSQFLAHPGQRMIKTLSPGATMETVLNKQSLGFSADWIFPRTYGFHLIYSTIAGYGNDLASSNLLTMRVEPPLVAGPAPLTLTLSGPETVAVGEPVHVELSVKNNANFAINGPVQQLDVWRYPLVVRDESGREVPFNRYADSTGSSNIAMTAVDPGGVVKSYLVLNPFYDLSHPGIYRIQTSLPVPGVESVSSNVILLRVRPASQR